MDTFRESSRSLEEIALPPDDPIRFITDLIKSLRRAHAELRRRHVAQEQLHTALGHLALATAEWHAFVNAVKNDSL